MLALYIVLTLGLSFLNAWSVGHQWTESKAIGGLAHFCTWCGGIMASVGFTYVYFILVALGLQAHGDVKPEQVDSFISLGYLIVIFPAIGSGLAITIQSYAHFWRNRTFGNGAVSAWNTYAQVSNMFEALEGVPRAYSSASKLWDSDSKSDSDKDGLLLLLGLLALAAGILTTIVIVRTVDAMHMRDVRFRALSEME